MESAPLVPGDAAPGASPAAGPDPAQAWAQAPRVGPVAGHDGFYKWISIHPVRQLMEAVLLGLTQVLIVYNLWPHTWHDAYETLWIHLHLATLAMEFSVSCPGMSFVAPRANIYARDLCFLQVMSLLTVYTDLMLGSRAVDDLSRQPTSGEFRERVGVVAVSLLLTAWRLWDVWDARHSHVPVTHSPQTESPIYPRHDQSLVMFPAQAQPFAHVGGKWHTDEPPPPRPWHTWGWWQHEQDGPDPLVRYPDEVCYLCRRGLPIGTPVGNVPVDQQATLCAGHRTP